MLKSPTFPSYQIAQRQVPVHQSNTSVLVLVLQVSQAPWHQDVSTSKQSTSTSSSNIKQVPVHQSNTSLVVYKSVKHPSIRQVILSKVLVHQSGTIDQRTSASGQYY